MSRAAAQHAPAALYQHLVRDCGRYLALDRAGDAPGVADAKTGREVRYAEEKKVEAQRVLAAVADAHTLIDGAGVTLDAGNLVATVEEHARAGARVYLSNVRIDASAAPNSVIDGPMDIDLLCIASGADGGADITACAVVHSVAQAGIRPKAWLAVASYALDLVARQLGSDKTGGISLNGTTTGRLSTSIATALVGLENDAVVVEAVSVEGLREMLLAGTREVAAAGGDVGAVPWAFDAKRCDRCAHMEVCKADAAGSLRVLDIEDLDELSTLTEIPARDPTGLSRLNEWWQRRSTPGGVPTSERGKHRVASILKTELEADAPPMLETYKSRQPILQHRPHTTHMAARAPAIEMIVGIWYEGHHQQQQVPAGPTAAVALVRDNNRGTTTELSLGTSVDTIRDGLLDALARCRGHTLQIYTPTHKEAAMLQWLVDDVAGDAPPAAAAVLECLRSGALRDKLEGLEAYDPRKCLVDRRDERSGKSSVRHAEKVRKWLELATSLRVPIDWNSKEGRHVASVVEGVAFVAKRIAEDWSLPDVDANPMGVLAWVAERAHELPMRPDTIVPLPGVVRHLYAMPTQSGRAVADEELYDACLTDEDEGADSKQLLSIADEVARQGAHPDPQALQQALGHNVTLAAELFATYLAPLRHSDSDPDSEKLSRAFVARPARFPFPTLTGDGPPPRGGPSHELVLPAVRYMHQARLLKALKRARYARPYLFRIEEIECAAPPAPAPAATKAKGKGKKSKGWAGADFEGGWGGGSRVSNVPAEPVKHTKMVLRPLRDEASRLPTRVSREGGYVASRVGGVVDARHIFHDFPYAMQNPYASVDAWWGLEDTAVADVIEGTEVAKKYLVSKLSVFEIHMDNMGDDADADVDTNAPPRLHTHSLAFWNVSNTAFLTPGTVIAVRERFTDPAYQATAERLLNPRFTDHLTQVLASPAAANAAAAPMPSLTPRPLAADASQGSPLAHPLNEAQEHAVQRAIACRVSAVIGPPGSGKTRVLCEAAARAVAAARASNAGAFNVLVTGETTKAIKTMLAHIYALVAPANAAGGGRPPVVVAHVGARSWTALNEGSLEHAGWQGCTEETGYKVRRHPDTCRGTPKFCVLGVDKYQLGRFEYSYAGAPAEGVVGQHMDLEIPACFHMACVDDGASLACVDAVNLVHRMERSGRLAVGGDPWAAQAPAAPYSTHTIQAATNGIPVGDSLLFNILRTDDGGRQGALHDRFEVYTAALDASYITALPQCFRAHPDIARGLVGLYGVDRCVPTRYVDRWVYASADTGVGGDVHAASTAPWHPPCTAGLADAAPDAWWAAGGPADAFAAWGREVFTTRPAGGVLAIAVDAVAGAAYDDVATAVVLAVTAALGERRVRYAPLAEGSGDADAPLPRTPHTTVVYSGRPPAGLGPLLAAAPDAHATLHWAAAAAATHDLLDDVVVTVYTQPTPKAPVPCSLVQVNAALTRACALQVVVYPAGLAPRPAACNVKDVEVGYQQLRRFVGGAHATRVAVRAEPTDGSAPGVAVTFTAAHPTREAADFTLEPRPGAVVLPVCIPPEPYPP